MAATPTVDCAVALGLTATTPGSYSDTETALSAAEASATIVWDISQIAYTLLLAETPALPLLPFVSLGIAVFELVGLFGGGRPKFQDTNDVIAAYLQSKYWPLKALAADMQIWVRNGAPISDSNPAVQATFSAAKLGTIESIQQLAGWAAGAQSPGYWQLQRLINQSWVDSGGGQQAVAHVVNSIDRYTEILTCLKTQQGTQPPPGTPPPGAPPGPTLPDNCDSGNPDQDEVLDLCHNVSFQLSEIYDQLINGFTGIAGGQDTTCCANLVAAIAGVTRQLGVIAVTLAKSSTSIDLAPIATELPARRAAVKAYPPAAAAVGAAIGDKLDSIAAAIGDLAPKGTVDLSAIVEQLKRRNDMEDVPQ